jgi:hypothetical protein
MHLGHVHARPARLALGLHLVTLNLE